MVPVGSLPLTLLSSVPSCAAYVGPQWWEGILNGTEVNSSPKFFAVPSRLGDAMVISTVQVRKQAF